MSKLINRIEQLEELRETLATGDENKKIPVLNYLQLLDYHLRLLKEVDAYVDAIKEGNTEFVTKWYKNRVEE